MDSKCIQGFCCILRRLQHNVVLVMSLHFKTQFYHTLWRHKPGRTMHLRSTWKLQFINRPRQAAEKHVGAGDQCWEIPRHQSWCDRRRFNADTACAIVLSVRDRTMRCKNMYLARLTCLSAAKFHGNLNSSAHQCNLTSSEVVFFSDLSGTGSFSRPKTPAFKVRLLQEGC